MADGQMSEQSGVAGVPGSTGLSPVEMLRGWLQAQTAGATQMAPNLQHRQAQVTPYERPQSLPGVNARDQAQRNLSSSIHGVIGTVIQQVQQRKATEQQHVFDRFTQSVQGINAAQAQLQEAQAALKENPQDEQALQKVQQAQQALQQNRTILDSMFNGPHGEKNAKILGKGFGIDDKNANTPERQAAMKAMQKSMGVGEKPAGILSQLPQTMQRSPQSMQQQLAGIKGPTGNALLQSADKGLGREQQMTIQKLKQAEQQGITLDRLKMIGALKGIDVTRDEHGQLVTHIMGPEERAKVPYLKAQDELTAARAEAERAIADSKTNPNNPEMRIKMMDAQSRAVDAQARMLAANAAQMRAMTQQAKEPPEVAAARKDADRLETEYAKAQQYVATPSPTNDTALIFSYVRAQVAGAGRMTNTEIQLALKSGSFGTRISNMYNRATQGQLDPEFRQQAADSIKIAADKARLTAQKYDVQKEKDSTSDDDIMRKLEELSK